MNAQRRLVLWSLAAGAVPLLATAGGGPARVVQVRAQRFRFDPANIHLARGMPVTLELTTQDVAMGFNAPDFNVRGDILPGAVTRLHFTPAQAGTFTFACDLFCGAGHEDMSGVITVS